MTETPTATTTTATTEVVPPLFPGELRAEQGGAAGGVAALVMFLLWLRRRFSSDNKGISADKKEIGKNEKEDEFLAIVMHDRDDAVRALRVLIDQHAKDIKEAWRQHKDDAARIASLEAENRYQSEQLAALRAELSEVGTGLRRLKSEFRQSQFGALPGNGGAAS